MTQATITLHDGRTGTIANAPRYARCAHCNDRFRTSGITPEQVVQVDGTDTYYHRHCAVNPQLGAHPAAEREAIRNRAIQQQDAARAERDRVATLPASERPATPRQRAHLEHLADVCAARLVEASYIGQFERVADQIRATLNRPALTIATASALIDHVQGALQENGIRW